MHKKLSIDQVLTRGVADILPTKKSLADLMAKKTITLYQGFDPSMPSLHLGNFVGLMKLRQFQELGHKVIFLVGDFTGMIGDPTDKLATRKKLTRQEVITNAKTWQSQVSKILDLTGSNAAEIKFNSTWNDKLTFKDLIELTANFTVQQLLERDMFQQRLADNKPIHLHEFLYPVAQGFDSVSMHVDLEIGGSDQIFNMLAGRTLMKAVDGKEKFVLATKLLVDKEGKKVGKTTGNALFLDSSPEDFFAGIMSFPDETIELGFELLTEVEMTGLKEKIESDPMGEKKRLAYEVVKIIWGDEKAAKAQKFFESTVQHLNVTVQIPTLKLKLDLKSPNILDVVTEITKSRSESKRLVQQNAIDVNGEPADLTTQIHKGAILKIGKQKVFKVG